MKQYYRIMPGAKSRYAEECHAGGFIGVDWFPEINLNQKLPEDWREFNRRMRSVYLKQYPGKTKITAGLACGMTHTVCKGMVKGSVVLAPDGHGSYLVGVVTGDYEYKKGESLPHRRLVSWFPKKIERSVMSKGLQNSTGSIGAVSNITKHTRELEKLLTGNVEPDLIAKDETVEDPAVFALELHLEEFLVNNWRHTELGKEYDIYEDQGEIVGRQFPSDTGPIDILAIRKDQKELLVIELKKGRASDVVVGQIQRYMGYVIDDLAESNQTVRGIIIGFQDDLRIRRALSVTTNIEFYQYHVKFSLRKYKK